MRAIFIDAVKQEVREETLTEPTLKAFYKLIGCQLVDLVRIDDQNDLWVDDEGLLHNPENFFIYGDSSPLAGNGVITANDGGGHTIATTMSVEDVKAKVKFLSVQELQEKLGLE